MKSVNLSFNGKIPESYDKLQVLIKCFSCGEFGVSILENVADEDICIFQTFHIGSFNKELILLQIVCNILKQNNAKTTSYFVPFLPYTRQNNIKNKQGVIREGEIIANIINQCEISDLITYDMHNPNAILSFQCRVNNLSAMPIFINDIKDRFNTSKIVIVFPDEGAKNRFIAFFDETFEIAIIQKNRISNKRADMQLSGNVKNKTAIIIDDMIDTGQTIISASEVLLFNGAKNVYAYATHGIFSNNAIHKLYSSNITKITITNSLQHKFSKDQLDKFRVINIY